ncbi:MAG: FtsQ-type POTRA domain-containing protein [Gemmatimonadetes bacterium]|nr:FtsQ-type POTRA domain-containing protein [Gemmatimonadota bacterium]
MADETPRWRRRLRAAGLVLAALALVSSPWWGRAALRSLAFFRVRRVEIDGTRYVSPDEIVSRMRVDTTASVWDDVGPWERRVRQHPSVRDVRIERRLPGTLVVKVTENLPVALVQTAGGLVPVDAAGKSLPVDPAAADVDLPVLATRDSTALRVLGEMRIGEPALFARIGEVRRIARGDLLFRLTDASPAAFRDILAGPDVSAERLSDLIPVEQDLVRRQVRATEIDLRFRDQVIVRLP